MHPQGYSANIGITFLKFAGPTAPTLCHIIGDEENKLL